MRLKRIILECPTGWLLTPNDGVRTKEFYINVLIALADFEVPLVIRRTYALTDTMPRSWFAREGDLIFSYHTYLPLNRRNKDSLEKNVYRLKEAPIPPYYSIDTMGYSGWSSMANSEKYKKNIESIDLQEAKRIVREKREAFLTSLTSKYKQKDEKITFLNEKYVFFPLQVPHDPVSNLNSISLRDLLTKAATIAKEKKMLLVLKRHPFDKSWYTTELLREFSNNPYVKLTEGNIHLLNSHAHSVMSINSGSSLEALIVGASVWNVAKSEWWDAVNHIASIEDVEKVFADNQPTISDFQIKLMAFLFKNFWLKNSDLRAIKARISSIISKYEKENSYKEEGGG